MLHAAVLQVGRSKWSIAAGWPSPPPMQPWVQMALNQLPKEAVGSDTSWVPGRCHSPWWVRGPQWWSTATKYFTVAKAGPVDTLPWPCPLELSRASRI